MGANVDDKHAPGWYELPFWRLVAYVFYASLSSFFIGLLTATIGLSIVYPPLADLVIMSITTFLIDYWWVTPSTLAILSVIAYVKIRSYRKEKKLKQKVFAEVKPKQ
jgi:membrane protein implicated in regulation of membrane protease activity